MDEVSKIEVQPSKPEDIKRLRQQIDARRAKKSLLPFEGSDRGFLGVYYQTQEGFAKTSLEMFDTCEAFLQVLFQTHVNRKRVETTKLAPQQHNTAKINISRPRDVSAREDVGPCQQPKIIEGTAADSPTAKAQLLLKKAAQAKRGEEGWACIQELQASHAAKNLFEWIGEAY